MIDPIRRELLEVLAELSERAPDVRLGQMLTNVMFFHGDSDEVYLREVEDDRLLAAAKVELESRRRRREAA